MAFNNVSYFDWIWVWMDWVDNGLDAFAEERCWIKLGRQFASEQ